MNTAQLINFEFRTLGGWHLFTNELYLVERKKMLNLKGGRGYGKRSSKHEALQLRHDSNKNECEGERERTEHIKFH